MHTGEERVWGENHGDPGAQGCSGQAVNLGVCTKGALTPLNMEETTLKILRNKGKWPRAAPGLGSVARSPRGNMWAKDPPRNAPPAPHLLTPLQLSPGPTLCGPSPLGSPPTPSLLRTALVYMPHSLGRCQCPPHSGAVQPYLPELCNL